MASEIVKSLAKLTKDLERKSLRQTGPPADEPRQVATRTVLQHQDGPVRLVVDKGPKQCAQVRVLGALHDGAFLAALAQQARGRRNYLEGDCGSSNHADSSIYTGVTA